MSAAAFRHVVFAERYDAGKALRRVVTFETLGEFAAGARDPEAIIAQTNIGRLTSLLPLRREAMSADAFAFLRGAADVMAYDLAEAPVPGLRAQVCGDCHLMNFGAYESPEGNILFDINDFDETLPDIDITVDLKRLVASVAVAAREAGRSAEKTRDLARRAARAYRKTMRVLATLSPIEAWNARIFLHQAIAGLRDRALEDKVHAAIRKSRAERDAADNFPGIYLAPSGAWRIEDRPPRMFHVEDSADPLARVDIAALFASMHDSLSPQVSALLRRYELRDAAFKAVGVGSVGTFCAIGLFMTRDDEPLFLQLKEARASVLARLGGAPHGGAQGERVVDGQRVMQAASDLFLGWSVDPASGRHFYARHLKTRRLGSIAELFQESALADYSALCGRTLARAHARSADPATLAGYMGKSGAFEDAMASFAMLYAAQNQRDFLRFKAAGQSAGR